ncbi:MAG: helix-turn-helix domain-containing protein, partial [Acidobacteriota bacterium]|nr:helix-turn-helix domain-containing protein [Acidobacteriota bacterium]
AYSWPGNVRELENCVRRTAILAETDLIEPRDLGLHTPDPYGRDLEAFARVVGSEGGLDEVGRRAKDLAESLAIRRALETSGGNKRRAADLLEVNYKRLLARIRELSLDPAEGA